jgi:hypothetical protein
MPTPKLRNEVVGAMNLSVPAVELTKKFTVARSAVIASPARQAAASAVDCFDS